MRIPSLVFTLFILVFASTARAESDEEITQLLIQQSIAAYPGICACPYSLVRNGSRCGTRSSYSRDGAAAPLCYPDDVTPEMIEDYRKVKKASKPTGAVKG